MPKSKKPPAKGPEAKPVGKPVVSKAPPPPMPAAKPAAGPAKPGVGVTKPGVKVAVVPGKAAAPAKPGVATKGTAKSASMAKDGSGAKNGSSAKAPAVVGSPPKGAPVAKAKAPKVPKPVPVPQPAEPRKWPKGGPTKPELKHYRDRLLEMRRALLSSSKELAAEALKSSGQDFSVDHMADNGSDNYEQDFSLKLLEGESEQLADIREALMKIDGKVETPFGICEACADEDQKLCETCPWIPPSRLEVLPHARLCVQTKEIEERRRT